MKVYSQGEIAGQLEIASASVPTSPNSGVAPGIAAGLQFRMDERFEVDGNAEFQLLSGTMGPTLVRGTILDISASGCYLRTIAPVRIRLGSIVEIEFLVYGTTFRVEAVSRFSKARVGIGFRFLEMNAKTRARLYAVLADMRSKSIRADAKPTAPIVDRNHEPD